jgi:hypothetical protein
MTANKKLRERLTDWTAGTVTRVDAYGREIRVGDVVRYVRNHDERRVVASFDTPGLAGVRFTTGKWTKARHIEVIRTVNGDHNG